MNKIYLIKYNNYLIFRRPNFLKEKSEQNAYLCNEIWWFLFKRQKCFQ